MDNPDGDAGDKIYNQTCLKHLVDQQKSVSLDRTVEEFVMEMTNEFITSLMTNSAELSQHRKAEFLEAQDLNFVLENIWKMHGYKSDEAKAGQKRNLTDVHPMHEARMNNIKKLQQPPDKKKGPKKT